MTTDTSLRQRLIDAGVDLVLTEGSASLGLREIARRAGVSHGAPRRYFPTHHSLLAAIAHQGFADLKTRFEAATASATTPRAQLEALAHAYVTYALERRGMFELMFRHDLLDSTDQSPRGPRLRESTLPLFEHLTALVSRITNTPDPALTAAALWSNLHGIAQLWTWGSLQLATEQNLDRLVTAALTAHLGPAA